MFKVKISLPVVIRECPEDGLPAIDFRRANGLPDDPNNKVAVKCEVTSEAVCRHFAALTDSDGDLILERETYGGYFSSRSSSELMKAASTAHPNDRPSPYGLSAPATVLLPFTRTDVGVSDDGVIALLDALIESGTARRGKEVAERDERQRRADERAAEQQRVREETAAAEARAKAEKKEKRVAEMTAWADAHGSDRLKECLANGWECGAVYRDERLAVEFPEWELYDASKPSWDDPRNPPTEAIALFKRAVATLPEDCRHTAELKFWTATDSDDYHDDPVTHSGYAVIANPGPWCQQAIVFGYTGPDVSE